MAFIYIYIYIYISLSWEASLVMLPGPGLLQRRMYCVGYHIERIVHACRVLQRHVNACSSLDGFYHFDFKYVFFISSK